MAAPRRDFRRRFESQLRWMGLAEVSGLQQVGQRETHQSRVRGLSRGEDMTFWTGGVLWNR